MSLFRDRNNFIGHQWFFDWWNNWVNWGVKQSTGYRQIASHTSKDQRVKKNKPPESTETAEKVLWKRKITALSRVGCRKGCATRETDHCLLYCSAVDEISKMWWYWGTLNSGYELGGKYHTIWEIWICPSKICIPWMSCILGEFSQGERVIIKGFLAIFVLLREERSHNMYDIRKWS